MSIKVIIDNYKSHESNYTERTDIEFISCEEKECDIYIVIDYIRINKPIHTKCRDGGFWIVPYEPPVECYQYFTESYKYFDLVNTHFANLESEVEKKVIRDRYPIMPFIKLDNSTADKTNNIRQQKQNRVSAVISSAANLQGHKIRTNFMTYLIENKFDFDRFGAGINWIPNKADALLPYKYSIGMENSSIPFYCTEKIADCFSCLTMPVYWGCPNITEYFPEESMILIDENDFKLSLEIIEEAVRNNHYNKNYDAIVYARERLFKEHTIYPYICRLIDKYYNPTSEPKAHYFPGRLSPKEHKLSYKLKKSLGVYYIKNLLRSRKLHRKVKR